MWLAGQAEMSTAATASTNRYETRALHDPNGIGKFYMGREIAHVMGHQAAEWLERPEREQEEKTSRLLQALNFQPGEKVADIGAGTGYLTRRIAPKVFTRRAGVCGRDSTGDAGFAHQQTENGGNQ